MTNKTSTIRTLGIAALAGLTTLLGSPTTRADDFKARTRVEATTDVEDNLIVKSTLGIAKKGESEFLRVYDFNVRNKDQSTDYTAAAIQLPKIEFGDFKNTIILGFNSGDINGACLDYTATFGNTRIAFNADYLDSELRSGNRFGGSLEQTFGNLTLGTRIDSTVINGDDTNSFLVNGVYDLNKHNQIGLGLRSSTNDTTTNSVIGYWMNHGRDLGHRTWVRVDSNKETDTNTVIFDSIIAQKPTFATGRGASGNWLVGGDTGDMYDSGIITRALNAERVPLGYRGEGFIGEIFAVATDSNGNRSGSARFDAGYTFPKFAGISLSANGIYEHRWNGSESQDRVGASVMAGKGPLTLEITGTDDISGNGSPSVYGSVTYNIGF